MAKLRPRQIFIPDNIFNPGKPIKVTDLKLDYRKIIGRINSPLIAAPIFINPSLGIPKGFLKVPIDERGKCVDTIWYTDPSGKNIHYYLPHYSLEEHRVSGKQQFQIKLREHSDKPGGVLSVLLKKGKAPGLPSIDGTQKELLHEVTLSLSFVTQEKVLKKLDFQEVVFQDDGLSAELSVTSLNELSQLYQALTEIDFQAKLEIQRNFQIATPKFLPVALHRLNPIKHIPDFVFEGTKNVEIKQHKYKRFNLGVQNFGLFPDALFEAAPDLPRINNRITSRSLVTIFSQDGKALHRFYHLSEAKQLQKLFFNIQAGKSPHFDYVYVQIEDRKSNAVFRSTGTNIIHPQAILQELFLVNSKSSPQKVALHFPRELHEYIFSAIEGGSASNGGYIPHMLSWKGKEHLYLQDQFRPEKYLYLPDEFRLTRVEGIPRPPWMQIVYQGEAYEDITAELNYRAVPFVEAERLEAAKQYFSSGESALELELEPLLVPNDQLRLKMDIPGEDGFQERPSALLSMSQLEDSLPPITLDDFKRVFNSLVSEDERSTILRGHVEVDVEGLSIPPVPVNLRFAKMIGDGLFVNTELEDTDNRLAATVTNVIKSPVKALDVKAFALIDGERHPLSLSNLSFPLELSPGDSRKFFITPPEVSNNIQNIKIEFNWEGLEVDLKLDALYDSILSDSIDESYIENVQITCYSLESVDPDILAIKVDFKNSPDGPIVKSIPILSQKDTFSTQLALPMPIRDYLLGLPTAGQYWYRITTIKNSGEQAENWRKGTGAFFITADKIASAT